MQLFDQLRNLGEEVLREFPMVNRGGCGVFASLVAQELERKNIEVGGFVAMNFFSESSGISIDKARANIRDIRDHWQWANNGIYFNHVGVEFVVDHDDYHYDVQFLHHRRENFDRMMVVPGKLSVKELVWIASYTEGWNSAFNRDAIPKMKRMVKKFLK